MRAVFAGVAGPISDGLFDLVLAASVGLAVLSSNQRDRRRLDQIWRRIRVELIRHLDARA